MQRPLYRFAAAIVLLLVLLPGAFALGRWSMRRQLASGAEAQPRVVVASPSAGRAPITVFAHNLALRKGEHFRIFVRWIHGVMEPTRKDVNPSFDAPDSFVLHIEKGVIGVHFADLNDFLNQGSGTGSPLSDINLHSDGQRLELDGTLHKLIPMPVQVTGTMTPLPDGRVQFHLESLHILKMPMKRLLGWFHVQLSDLVASPHVEGIEIVGNDVRFDTEKLLPPPHIHGDITSVLMSPVELKVIYGPTADKEDELAQWHNFLRFRGGSLDFGKLTMHDVDLTMIDAVEEPWFDLDLTNYQAQLVNSYTRMTAQAGLEIYMPDVSKLPKQTDKKAITLEWLKNRNSALPSDVPFKEQR